MAARTEHLALAPPPLQAPHVPPQYEDRKPHTFERDTRRAARPSRLVLGVRGRGPLAGPSPRLSRSCALAELRRALRCARRRRRRCRERRGCIRPSDGEPRHRLRILPQLGHAVEGRLPFLLSARGRLTLAVAIRASRPAAVRHALRSGLRQLRRGAAPHQRSGVAVVGKRGRRVGGAAAPAARRVDVTAECDRKTDGEEEGHDAEGGEGGAGGLALAEDAGAERAV